MPTEPSSPIPEPASGSSDCKNARFGGKTYSVVKHSRNPRYILKQAVNRWLAQVAQAVLLRNGAGANKSWALLLETSELHTLRALEAATPITAATTVVPNPNEGQLTLMRAAAPGITALKMTSHTLLRALCDPGSLQYQQLRERKGQACWPGCFSVVWLDYCGTFASTAGRQRDTITSPPVRPG